MRDAELLDTIRNRLFTAVIGDVMDAAGLLHQFLPPRLRPLDESTVLVGRAMTVQVVDIDGCGLNPPSPPPPIPTEQFQ